MVERLRLPADRFTLLAVAVFGGLAFVLLAVGIVAMVAEFKQTWEYYFLFEQATAMATPVAAGLAVAAFVVGLAAVARS